MKWWLKLELVSILIVVIVFLGIPGLRGYSTTKVIAFFNGALK